MNRHILLSLLIALGLAALASGQTGRNKYSNAPSDVDYRINVLEPKPGATIVGKDVNIVISLPPVPPGNGPQSSASDLKERDMNTPIFQIWVDGKDFGNLPGGQNVLSREISPTGLIRSSWRRRTPPESWWTARRSR